MRRWWECSRRRSLPPGFLFLSRPVGFMPRSQDWLESFLEGWKQRFLFFLYFLYFKVMERRAEKAGGQVTSAREMVIAAAAFRWR